MKILLLSGLAGAAAIFPAAASATDSKPVESPPNPVQHQVNYDNSVLMNDDRVIAGTAFARGGSATYQGEWVGAYREDGTYQGEWRGTYRDQGGKLYDGQYAGTFIGKGVPYPAPSPEPAPIGTNHALAPVEAPPQTETAPVAITATRAGADYAPPHYQANPPQYAEAPVPPTSAVQPAANPQYQTQYRYPSGWNGYYYPPHFPPATTTIVIHSAPGTTTTTYYED